MTEAISIAELIRRGVVLAADEAVAIAQQLIHNPAASPPEPPFGPPSADNVYVRSDGSIFCRACEMVPAVSEIAILLKALLPPQTTQVPAALRYTIARALLDVDGPPFDSIEQFSSALASFERIDRRAALRNVLSRAGVRSASIAPPAVVSIERRRSVLTTTDLRRHLRDADRRAYLQQVALQKVTLQLVAATHRSTPPVRRVRAVAFAVVFIVMLIPAGDVRRDRSDLTRTPATPVVTGTTESLATAGVRSPLAAPQPQAEPGQAPRPAHATRAGAKAGTSNAARAARSSSPAPRVRRASSARRERDRPLQWLKNVLAFRSEPI
jgi:hypothetical protein